VHFGTDVMAGLAKLRIAMQRALGALHQN
jgi:hypothetical protein